MTACVAISPDARMDSSTACESLHGCMSDDLDPSFRPSVEMLKVDVISAYMTAAAEIAERQERASATSSRDSAQVHAEEVQDLGEREKSEEISVLKELNIAEREADVTPFVLQDSKKRDHEDNKEKSNEFRKQMEANAAVAEPAAQAVEATPNSVQLKVEEDVPVESSEALIEEKTEVGHVAQHATAEVSGVDITVKEDAELTEAKGDAEIFSEDVDIVENVKVEDEGEFIVTESAVSGEENFVTVIENPDLGMHAYSDSTTAASNPVIETLEPNEESTVPESMISAEAEAGATDSAELTESTTKVAKAYPFEFTGLNHVALCCESLERSLDFYCGLLGLKTNLDRPNLPYRGAWLLLGAEGIHIMEVPNPDPVKGRPPHGGYDRHACLNVKNVDHLRMTFEKAGINYQLSMVPSIFCRDPDGNGLEFIEVNGVHVD